MLKPADIVGGEFLVEPGHPSLPGHFPGNPVVPGVVLLQRILAAIEDAGAGFGEEIVVDAKFLEPVRPGQQCSFAVSRTEAGRLRFECRVDGRTVAKGTLRGEPIR